MIEERTMELINDAMDGELSEAEQAELAGRLAQSEEARNYQTGMNELDVLLQELPNQPMPEELHRNIIHNIKLADRPTMRPLSRIGNWSGFVRYGFAAAAGLLLAVGIYQFGSETGPKDVDRMIGTIAPGDTNAVVLGTYAVDLDELNSLVSLERRGAAIVLNVELDSTLPVDLRVDFAGSNLRYDTMAQMDNDLESFESADQVIRSSSGVGRQKFAVLLRHADDTVTHKDEAIVLEYSSNGNLIQQGTLTPRW